MTPDDFAENGADISGLGIMICAFYDTEREAIDLSGLLDAFALLADGLESPRAGALQALLTACKDKLVRMEAALDVARQQAFRDLNRG